MPLVFLSFWSLVILVHHPVSGWECAFNYFGVAHAKLGNRLNKTLVMKLVRTYCYLRDKNSDSYDDLVDVEMASEDETVLR